MHYTVSTEEFEGPLSILLRMVVDKKVSINKISLAKITDDYVTHIKELPNFPIYSVSSTMVIIATLLLIKATTLMPQLEVTKEEEGDMQELEDRLVAYSRIKKTGSKIIKKYFIEPFFIRGKQLKNEVVFSPDDSCTKEGLLGAAISIFNDEKEFYSEKKFVEKKIEAIVSLEETMESLVDRIQTAVQQVKFSSIASTAGNKGDLIVSFLAVLELVKQGMINANQDDAFSDILLDKKEI